LVNYVKASRTELQRYVKRFEQKRTTPPTKGREEVIDGAEERTRTFMGLRPLAPEASASANSATSAQWALETPD
jgi:hypothetical protein